MIRTAPVGVGAADHEPFTGPAGPVNVIASVASGAGPTAWAVAEVVDDGSVLDELAPVPVDDLSSPQPARSAAAAVAPTPSSRRRRSASRRVRKPSAQSATISSRT